mmetsp:Transcript_121/g.543  ORF Transcript_121/g.543 Transcript_121/m.543 type:complete len:263 (+) Transcript_121:141-929(+)
MSAGGGLAPSATSPTIGTVQRTLTFIAGDASFDPSPFSPQSLAQLCAQTATSKESSALGFNSAILHLDDVAAHARLSTALVPDRSVSVMTPGGGSPFSPFSPPDGGIEPATFEPSLRSVTSNPPNGCAAMPVPSALTYDSFSVHVRMNVVARASSSPMARMASCSSALSHRPASLSAAALVRLRSSSQSTPTSCDAFAGTFAPQPGDADGVGEPQGFHRGCEGSIPGADVTARTTRRLVCETLNRIRVQASSSSHESSSSSV